MTAIVLTVDFVAGILKIDKSPSVETRSGCGTAKVTESDN